MPGDILVKDVEDALVAQANLVNALVAKFKEFKAAKTLKDSDVVDDDLRDEMIAALASVTGFDPPIPFPNPVIDFCELLSRPAPGTPSS